MQGRARGFPQQFAKRERAPFMCRQFWAALDDARQFKQDRIDHGEEPPAWQKEFRATRRVKGISTGKRPKMPGKGKKPGKPRRKVNYGLKLLVEASKAVVKIENCGLSPDVNKFPRGAYINNPVSPGGVLSANSYTCRRHARFIRESA